MISKFRAVLIGRPAVFLLPSDLMGTLIEGKTCRELVESYMATNFGGFTDEGSGHNGYWKNDSGKSYSDKYQKYRVSFLGKDLIPDLQGFLAYIGKNLRQESIYLETGEDAWLIFVE